MNLTGRSGHLCACDQRLAGHACRQRALRPAPGTRDDACVASPIIFLARRCPRQDASGAHGPSIRARIGVAANPAWLGARAYALRRVHGRNRAAAILAATMQIDREGHFTMPSLMLRFACVCSAFSLWPGARVRPGLSQPHHQVRRAVSRRRPADTFSRVLAEKMGALLGQTVVIENRAGAGGLTGTASVAKAEPDGYTIGIAASSALAINVNLRDNMPFHPLQGLPPRSRRSFRCRRSWSSTRTCRPRRWPS